MWLDSNLEVFIRGEAGVHGIRQQAVDKGGSSANREYIIFYQSGHTLPLCQNLWVLIPIDGGKCITQVDSKQVFITEEEVTGSVPG